MTTAVASPPSFQSLPKLGWNGANSRHGAFNSMSAEDVSRMFMPQRKVVQRTNSSSSIASSNSSTSTVIATPQPSAPVPTTNGDSSTHVAKKKPRGGFWPAKSESTAALTNARPNGAASTASQTVPALPSQGQPQLQTNGGRVLNGQGSMDQAAVLALLPLNGTFERKQINVPFFPDVLRVGRQTNAKTVPTPSNGFFDSKVLSRQHAELWAERNGKIWIRDVKSSNGTFVNGARLSAENRESEPHELRQHDTLELGIDIVSEDQKTIVHHKVSAKVEYVGLPGTSNNVMDLSFGDLDPSHGGPLLPSPMSSPMVHSRNRPGGALSSRGSAASSNAGSHASSLTQQRQLNFWGTPLNVEQLVKTLSTEMKAARQQAQDLDQAGTYLNAILAPDGIQEKALPIVKENSQSRQSNGRVRSLRLEPTTRFAEPPAPPPQQPLPEKPDVARSSLAESAPFSFLNRSNTTKPTVSAGNSPTNPQSSQIMSLIEALSIAKKEIDSQGAKVKHLEDMLRKERSARESAEERARRLEQHVLSQPVSAPEENVESLVSDGQSAPPTSVETDNATDSDLQAESTAHQLQKRLDQMVSEMHRMSVDMEKFRQRAEVAENEAGETRVSLAEMIARLRDVNPAAITEAEEDVDGVVIPSNFDDLEDDEETQQAINRIAFHKHPVKQANGHVRPLSRLPEHLERAVATVFRDSNANGEMLAESAPYVSMLGVVLIGVGLMAYLNSWQKTER